MNTITFLSQPLLWGLLLATVPVIIHLLYRRRFRRIDWAPMKYLKLSIRRNRRRIRIEQLLLLLLRTALVLLLFFLVARPVMHADSLGRWLGSGGRMNQILIVDDSLSMDYSEAGKTALERAQRVALEILDTIGPKDRFTLALSSRPRSPLLREIEVDDPQMVAGLINEIKATGTYTHWEPTLEAVDELIFSGTYPIRRLTLITDLRGAGWDERIKEIAASWAGENVELRIFDVGSSQIENVALEALEPLDRVSLVGTPSRWEAVVRNDSSEVLQGLEATFTVDGKPGRVELPVIQPGQVAQVPLAATFQKPGSHHVSFHLPDDALSGDNARWSAVDVRERLRMVLIDGEPSSDPLAGEVDFLALSLSLGVSEADTAQIEIMTDSQWATTSLVAPDLLVLANVAAVTADQAKELRRVVENGAGLMIFVGEQVDVDNYNQFLFQDGTGILPMSMESIAEGQISGLLVDDVANSPLSVLSGLSAAALERIEIRKFINVLEPPEPVPGVRVLARWNNASGSPAAIEKTVGRGLVLLWTMTADKAWSDWPLEPSFVLGMREASRAIARIDESAGALVAGQAMRLPLSTSREITSAEVEIPGAGEPESLRIVDRADGGSTQDKSNRALALDDTSRAGLYTLNWVEGDAGAQSVRIAVNPDARESDLGRISTDNLSGLFSPLEPSIISANSTDNAPPMVAGQEMWRPLAALLLGLLFCEACLATWTGRQR